jgi:hypothetical protein
MDDKANGNFEALISILREKPYYRTIIQEVLTRSIAEKDWNFNYWDIKGRVFPALIGSDASSAFFAFLLRDEISLNEYQINKEIEDYLLLCKHLFTRACRRAENYTAYPLGLEKISISFNEIIKNSVINLSRNDGQCFELSIDPDSFYLIVTFLLSYKEKIEEIHGRTVKIKVSKVED